MLVFDMTEMIFKILIFGSILSFIRCQPTSCHPCECYHDNVTLAIKITCTGEGPKMINWGILPRLQTTLELRQVKDFEFNHIPADWRILISTIKINSSFLHDLDLSGFNKVEMLRINNSKISNEKSMEFPATIKYLAVTNSGLNCFNIGYEHSVEVLDLSGNNIDEIPITMSIVQLILKKNNLKGVNFSFDKEAKCLQNIDLSDNKISDLPETLFKNVIHQGNKQKITINFANNEIRTIHPRAFAGIQIEKIRLDCNDLHTIDQSLLDWDQVEYIDLQQNPWDCECTQQWMLDILLPKLYEKKPPSTLIDLRCGCQTKFKGKQFAYWLNRTSEVFCGASSAFYDGANLQTKNEEIYWTSSMIATVVLGVLVIALLIIFTILLVCPCKKTVKKEKGYYSENRGLESDDITALRKYADDDTRLLNVICDMEYIQVKEVENPNSKKTLDMAPSIKGSLQRAVY